MGGDMHLDDRDDTAPAVVPVVEGFCTECGKGPLDAWHIRGRMAFRHAFRAATPLEAGTAAHELAEELIVEATSAEPRVYRILRILEYTYDSMEDMMRDMGTWNLGQMAQKQLGRKGQSMVRSTVLPIDLIERPWRTPQEVEAHDEGRGA